MVLPRVASALEAVAGLGALDANSVALSGPSELTV